jgi:hypothetical protein
MLSGSTAPKFSTTHPKNPHSPVSGVMQRNGYITDTTYDGRFLGLRRRLASLAATAFFARSERASGVIVSRERFPPIFPPRRPCSWKYARTSGGNFFRPMCLS